MLQRDASPDPPRAKRWIVRHFGLYIIGGIIICTALSILALSFLAPLAADHPIEEAEIPALVISLVSHRTWLVLLALPGLICGAVLLRTGRRPVLLLLIGTACLLLPFAAVMYCFIMLIAPLYQIHPL